MYNGGASCHPYRQLQRIRNDPLSLMMRRCSCKSNELAWQRMSPHHNTNSLLDHAP
jgi:hypothetical protein